MQLGPSSRAQIPDGLLAAMTLLSEKPHQGVPSSTHTMYQGFGFVIANPALGMPPMLYDEGLGSRCTGKERDTESGNDYFNARYYNSNTGRFLSPDPIWITPDRMLSPQRQNLYSYAVNNPLRFTDPTGMDVNLGHCPKGTTIASCETAIKNGVPKADRSHINFVDGDGKNGIKKGEIGIKVDKDYKSSSLNFSTLQSLANDHSAVARVGVYAPSERFPMAAADGFSAAGGTTYKFTTVLMGTPQTNGADGWTLFPIGSNGNGPNSVGPFTDVIANSIDGVSENIYHELQHVYLGDFGRNAKAGEHGSPMVNERTKAAEDEARQNAKDQ